MATTTTTNYGFTKPDIGGEADTWGGELNANWDSLDAKLKAVSDLTVPLGTIVMWSGSAASIPARWSLCNGTNGTPNLVNKFILGSDGTASGSTVSVGANGGSETTAGAGSHSHTTGAAGAHSHTTDVQGVHSHGGATVGTALDVSQIPNHRHWMFADLSFDSAQANVSRTVSRQRNSGGHSGDYVISQSDGREATVGLSGPMTGGGQAAAHNHAVSWDGAHGHNLSTAANHQHSVSLAGDHTHGFIPPYYALCFIMLTG